jgi:methyl-accepting chemotaxis protein
VTKAGVSVHHTQAAFEELASIGLQVDALQLMNEQVAAATEEQSTVSQNISAQVQQMSEGFQHSVGDANEVRQCADDIAKLAADLSILAGQFRL